MMSDDSENDGIYVENNYENDVYYKKYQLLLEKCETIQKHNEQLVYRIQNVKRITNNRYESVKELKQRLKQHGEDWAVIPREDLDDSFDLDQEKNQSLKFAIKIKEEKPDIEEKVVVEKQQRTTKKAPKRKSNKTEKDPNAPKRPSNPFFQYCQEQRQILMEQLNAELKPGETELTKQELTRQLAIRWKSLTGSDKKVYVDMYERSKEKYAAEMSEYNMKK